ncbi:serine carboxypeptidase-like 51 [Impatiens glandulifera]|uniref:serine carboxypeptidase-like 51 n=1 Tax=Impatiens glandulifera TaxID=253017 RepID=UPI001FB19F22|nr:serine carboxypeptidase-like 51 [Impatiens glandulifera]
MERVKKFTVILCGFWLLSLFFNGGGFTIAARTGTDDGSERWGYVQVRPRAHMFWWYYKSPFRIEHPNKPWPIILWLQGGPGGSGVAIGNFEEFGPLDTNLKPRNSTWLRKADLLFVDNPVGTGFSFVEDEKLLVKTDEEAATDLTTLLKGLFNKNKALQNSPLHIFAESYGGKYAVTLALSVLKAIKSKTLKLNLAGVTIGDSWISPEDFVFSWAPLLKDLSRIDNSGVETANMLTQQIKKQIENGQFQEATDTWNNLENMILQTSNYVDFYNFLLDSAEEKVEGITVSSSSSTRSVVGGRTGLMQKYSTYLESLRIKASNGGDGVTSLPDLMNGHVKNKLKIIPPHVTWGFQAQYVFNAQSGDFMKPRINEVDQLLAKGVNFTIYTGQVDLICSTKGTQAWVEKLKWKGLKEFLNMDRTPLYCGDDKRTRGFTKSYRNLHFYWFLETGHFAPVDQPCVALDMVGAITQSPVASK